MPFGLSPGTWFDGPLATANRAALTGRREFWGLYILPKPQAFEFQFRKACRTLLPSVYFFCYLILFFKQIKTCHANFSLILSK
jgi:hypothetical protein